MTRQFALVLAVALLTTASPVQGQDRTSGLGELLVVESAAHHNGRPSVEFETNPRTGQLEVKVNPTLHIHVNFYSGEKEFQGPIIAGGPTMIVATHPDTGERSYIQTSLPQGSPLVVHKPRTITYVYPESRVVIDFPRRDDFAAVVRHIENRGWRRVHSERTANLAQGIQNTLTESSTITAIRETAVSGQELVKGTVVAIDDLGSELISTLGTITESLPGASTIRNMATDRQSDRALEIRNERLNQQQSNRYFEGMFR